MAGPTKHQVLCWLVEVEDEPGRSAALTSGMALINEATRTVGIEHSDAGWGNLARHIAQLKREGAVDYDYFPWPHQPEPALPRLYDGQHLQRCQNFTVTGQGRQAVAGSGPQTNLSFHHSTIGQVAVGDINNLTLVGLFDAVERQIESMEAPAAQKDEARRAVGAARAAVTTIGTSAAGGLVTAALRAVLGF